MFRKIKLALAVAAAASAVQLATPAQAVTVTSFEIQGQNMYWTDVAGVQGDTHVPYWNNWGTTGTGTSRTWAKNLDNHGTFSGITATATRNLISGYSGDLINNNFRTSDPADGDRILMQTGMDMGDGNQNNATNGNALSISAANIPYAKYDLYVYVLAKEGGIARITLNGGQDVKTLKEVSAPNYLPNPEGGINYVESTSTAFSSAATQGHYVKFSDLTGDAFTFDVATTWRTQPTGFQIVDTSSTGPAPIIENYKWTFDNGNLFDTTGTIGFNITGGTAFNGQPIPYAPSPDNVDANNPFGGGTHLVRTDFLNTNGVITKPGDSPQGSLTSDPFLLGERATFSFHASGNGGRVELIDALTGDVLTFLAPGRQSVTLEQYIMDASAFAGETVRLRIVDNASGGWGHIAVDNLNYSAVLNVIPEPATGLLSMLSVLPLAIRRRRGAGAIA